MRLIERDPTGELQVPIGINKAPDLPNIAPEDTRPTWEIMDYDSLDELNDAIFPEEVVDEAVRAQQQRDASTRSVNIRRAPLYETSRPIGTVALVAGIQRAMAFQEALQAGVEAGHVYFLFDTE